MHAKLDERLDLKFFFAKLSEKLRNQLKREQEKLPKGVFSSFTLSWPTELKFLVKDLKVLQDVILSELINYEDFYLPRSSIENAKCVRDAVTLHSLNHIMR